VSGALGSLPRVVLFDLDGTLSDSAPGILASLRHAFEVNGLPWLDPEAQRSVLGPPFYAALPRYVGEERVPAVVAAYRERYAAGGMYQTSVYPGIPETLRALAEHGVRLAVATSKPERYAEPIVAHLGLDGMFETVGGDRLDGSRGTKALVVGEVLRRLGNPDPATVLMVGDREHDVHGARAHDVGTVGAGWGYAAPGELENAGALAVCVTAAQLRCRLGLPGEPPA